MIQEIGEMIHKAIDEAPYQVKFDSGVYKVICGQTDVFCTPLHDQAEDIMDNLNDKWIARKVVEEMKGLFNNSDWQLNCEHILNA